MTAARRDHPKPSLKRKNFVWGVMNGILSGPFIALLDPSLVLSVFVSALTDSAFWLGLLTPISTLGSLAFQFMGVRILEGRESSLSLYREVTVWRLFVWMPMILAALLTDEPAVLLLIFYAVLLARSFVTGLAVISWEDAIGKTILPEERGLFFSIRMTIGRVLALIMSVVVGWALSDAFSWPFPRGFAFIFCVAVLFRAMASACMFFVDEPPRPTKREEVREMLRISERARAFLGDVAALVREDDLFRRLLAIRALSILAGSAGAFVFVYAQDRFGVPDSAISTYLALQTLAGLLANSLAGWLSVRFGNKRLAVLGKIMGLIPLALLLLAHFLNVGTAPAEIVLGAIYLIGGVGGAFFTVGMMALKINIAPDDRRPFYLGALNTLTGLAGLLTMFSGVVAQILSTEALFALSIALNVVALWSFRTFRDPTFEPPYTR